MNKKITQILSLTVLIITAFCWIYSNESSKTDIFNENTEEYSKELASLNINDTSIVSKTEEIDLEDIRALNLKLKSLEEDVVVLSENAKTSYYHDKFNGKKTASGEVYHKSKYTAAHKTLPFGSKLRVTNVANQESVIVTVNDRGPFSGGRNLDLSKQAFLDITHNRNIGTLNVKIEVLPENYDESIIEIEKDLSEFIL